MSWLSEGISYIFFTHTRIYNRECIFSQKIIVYYFYSVENKHEIHYSIIFIKVAFLKILLRNLKLRIEFRRISISAQTARKLLLLLVNICQKLLASFKSQIMIPLEKTFLLLVACSIKRKIILQVKIRHYQFTIRFILNLNGLQCIRFLFLSS